jgi:hypothetical protein
MRPMTSRIHVVLVTIFVAGIISTARAEVPPSELAPRPLPPLFMPAEPRSLELASLRRRMNAQQQPPAPQEEFRPISELPPEEKLPAAPLLVAAYVFVTLALFAYVYSLTRRLGAVKADIARLESDMKRSGRT